MRTPPETTPSTESPRRWPPLLWDAAAFAMLAAGGALVALAAAQMTPAPAERAGGRMAAVFDGAAIETANIAEHGATAWSYHGDTGPEHWADLTPANAACMGEQQSPVDLAGGLPADTGAFELYWNLAGFNVRNNGHTLQVDLQEGAQLNIAGKTYQLKQFHFHTPSEHAVDGERAAMEAHFVHVAPDGALAVVGVLMRAAETEEESRSASSRAFHQVMTQATDHAGLAPLPYPVKPVAFLPMRREMLRYQGSLTTPPCSETVLWSVFKEPVPVMEKDIERFVELFHDNARPLQPLHRRFLLIGN